MSTKVRRWCGAGLIGGVLLVSAAVQFWTGKLVTIHAGPSGTVPASHGVLSWDVQFLTPHPVYALPLAAVALIGLLCLVLPPRRPPKLSR